MKTRHVAIIFLVAFTIVSTNLSAQRIKGYVAAGLNGSQIAGDEAAGFKRWGFNGGVGAMLPLNKKETWNVGLEALLSQKGSYEDDRVLYYSARLTYAEVPVLAYFSDKKGGITAGVGVSYGRLVTSPNEKAIYKEDDLIQVTNKEFSKNDFSALLDLRIKIWQQLKFNFRYAYSFIPIKSDIEYNSIANGQVNKSWKRDFYNSTITFRILWVFNEEQPLKKKSRKR